MSEEAEIKRVGATPIKNSGRGIKKGDFLLPPFLGDVKEYEEGFRVTRANWAKISTDATARNDGSQPAYYLCLRPKGNPLATPLRLWVIGDSMMQEMYEAWKEKYGEV